MHQTYRPPLSDEAALAIGVTAFALSVEPQRVAGAARGSEAEARCRQIAMYLMYVTAGVSLAKVALAFGRDRSTVSHACHLVEDKRDDDAFDAWIEEMQEVIARTMALRQAVAGPGAEQ